MYKNLSKWTLCVFDLGETKNSLNNKYVINTMNAGDNSTGDETERPRRRRPTRQRDSGNRVLTCILVMVVFLNISLTCSIFAILAKAHMNQRLLIIPTKLSHIMSYNWMDTPGFAENPNHDHIKCFDCHGGIMFVAGGVEPIIHCPNVVYDANGDQYLCSSYPAITFIRRYY